MAKAAEKFALEEVTLPIGDLIPNPKNPRVHPQAQLVKLAESINRFGQPRRVLVRKANKMLIAGHGLTEAMKLARKTEIQVSLWDVNQRTADAFMLGDNRLAEIGSTDARKAAALLQELDEELWLAVGYTDDEAEAELEKLEEDRIDVVEIETSEVEDRFWIVIRGPMVDQARSLQLLQGVMGELGGVSVELGTEQGD